jgi:hypothetical protein
MATPTRSPYESVFIVTYGRSGSTLLQGLLNSIPGWLVRGENFNFCHGLFHAHEAIENAKRQYGAVEASHSSAFPWFGAGELDPDAFLAAAREIVRTQLLGTGGSDPVTCIGFKEIRYPGLPDLHPFLDFLAKLFPPAAFLHLTRDPAEVARSAWWRTMEPHEVRREVEDFERDFDRWGAGRSDVFRLDYRDLRQDAPRLRAMFEFLQLPYDSAAVNHVLSRPHSYPGQP